MYLIIAGCGRVGSSLAERLSEIGHNVVLVDQHEDNFARLGSGCNCAMLTGLPIDEEVLKEAGIESADAVIAVTQDDNMNLMIAQIARRLYRVPTVVTRVYDPQQQSALNALGVDSVCPTSLTADCFYEKLTAGGTQP